MAWFRRDQDPDAWIAGLDERKPPKPTAHLHTVADRQVEPWSKATRWGVEIAGVHRYKDAVTRASTISGADRGGNGYPDAVLRAEPDNPQDRNAVRVYIAGQHVGYLARAEAKLYQPDLVRLENVGEYLKVPSWIAVSDSYNDPGEKYVAASITLPEPGTIFPVNNFPAEPYRVIPPGRAARLTNTDDHAAELAAYVQSKGEVDVAATLHVGQLARARSTVDIVEVCIDGTLIGNLTPAVSKHFLPLITHITDAGLVTVTRATVKGTSLRSDVSIRCAKAHEVPQDWVHSLTTRRR